MLNQGIPWLGIFILDSNSREKHETHPPYNYFFGSRRWRCPSDNLFDDGDGAQDYKISGTVAGWSVAVTGDESASTSSYSIGGNVAGVALTFTGTDAKICWW